MTSSQHVYEVRPRKDKRGFDLISDALPFDWPRDVSSILRTAKSGQGTSLCAASASLAERRKTGI